MALTELNLPAPCALRALHDAIWAVSVGCDLWTSWLDWLWLSPSRFPGSVVVHWLSWPMALGPGPARIRAPASCQLPNRTAAFGAFVWTEGGFKQPTPPRVAVAVSKMLFFCLLRHTIWGCKFIK
jgi:hypothetical protein